MSAGYNSLPHHRSKSRISHPAEARAWNCAVSTSTEIAAHSRFQLIKRHAVTGGPSFFTTRLLWIDASHLSRVENGKTRHLGAPVDKLARAMAMAASDQEFTKNILLHIAESRIQESKRKQGEKGKARVFKLISNRWNRAA